MTSTVFLEKALGTLEEALQQYQGRQGDLLARDGVIQRFEYCYELCVKTLEKILREESLSDVGFDGIFYKDLIRLAAKKGFIESPELWFSFRDARNKTSHAYSHLVAEEVFSFIQPFFIHAKALLVHLNSIDR